MSEARETGSIDMGVTQFGGQTDRQVTQGDEHFIDQRELQGRETQGFEEALNGDDENASKDSVKKGDSVALSQSHKESYNENQPGNRNI